MTRARDLAKLIAGSSTLGGTGELVLKDVDTADGSSPKITFQTGDTDIAADDVLGTIDFQAPDEGTGTDALLVAAGIEAVSEGDFSASSNATKLSFKTGASETATEKMTIKSDGNIGIGISPTTSYGNALQIHDTGTSGANLRLTDSTSGSGTGNGFEIVQIGVNNYTLNRENGFIATYTNNAERMRIDNNGTFLVGKTSDSGGVAGFKVETEGDTYITAEGGDGRCLYSNRLTSDGVILELAKDNTTVGTLGSVSGSYLYIGEPSAVGISFISDRVRPATDGINTDNTWDFGHPTVRWDDIYATNSTIQTSDENEKQNIASLTSAEITAATAISKLFKTFKWKDKVASKGNDARTHTGVIAQQVQTAMSDAGLDAGNYAFFISSTWWEKDVEVAAVEANEEKLIKAQDAYTRTDIYDTKDEAPEEATEHTRLGIRYPELLAFVGAATEQRLTSIEARLTALEAE